MNDIIDATLDKITDDVGAVAQWVASLSIPELIIYLFAAAGVLWAIFVGVGCVASAL